MSPPRGGRDQRGTALVEVSWLAILLMVPLVYVVLAVFDVQRSAFAVSAAARAAGRAYTLAPDQGTARAQAAAAARIALRDQGVDPSTVAVRITCAPDPTRCLSPGSVVRVDVGRSVVLPFLPAALGGARPSIRVEASHEVPYGTFREDRS